MYEIEQNEFELRKFNEWRKEINKKLPDLANRVFALRTKHYMGCGFHWSLEKDLGYVIHMANNFDRDYRDFALRSSAKAIYAVFIERIEEIERLVKCV